MESHQTKKQAISIADMAGVDTTTLALFSTFAKYYRFNLIAKALLNCGRRVLKLASSSNRVAGTGSLVGYCIPKKKI